MEVNLLWLLILWAISVTLMFPSTVQSDPISIDFNKCQASTYPIAPPPSTATEIIQCCPIKPTKPAIDGVPAPLSKEIRVRNASQCTDEAYATKLAKGYELMRALPDDDPRSFTQQYSLHCSYCGGAFITTNSSGVSEGIDIHFSWLFYPWHRYFLYFHERILQSLLDDPTFSLNYWDWGTPYSLGDGCSKKGACLKQGDDFPTAFSDGSRASYDVNRSENAKGNGRLHFPDFTFSPFLPAVKQPLYNATEQDLIDSNLNILYQALVSGGTTAEIFIGRPYRAGDKRGSPAPGGGGGSLEVSAHAGIHFWTGQDPPIGVDMGQLAWSARDPVFFAHHSNLDRLFTVWKDIGPILGQIREYYSDPDFLEAEFLFYDEKKDLRRVKVKDALDSKNLGYVYQETNDAAWIFFDPKRCSALSLPETVARAESLPVPVKDREGSYCLEPNTPFVLVIDRPDNPHGLEEFLVIDGIKLDRTRNAGFDVFVDLVNPQDYPAPCKCAEYAGRFTNMAQSHQSRKRAFLWKESITKTLLDINAPTAPSMLVITLMPLSGATDTIKFCSITVTTEY